MADEKSVDLAAVAAGLAAKAGDATKALERLVEENHELRQKNRDLRAEVTTAKAAAPGDGAVVLSGDDAKAWDAFKALGSATDVAARLAAGDEATAKLAGHERRAQLAAVAQAAGYAAPGAVDVLADLAGRPGAGFVTEVRDETVDGKAAKVAYARPAGDDKAAWAPLPAYLVQHHAAYVPALTAVAAGGQAGTPPRTTAAPGGPQYPPQAGGSTAPKAENQVDKLLEQNAARASAPNALRPAPAAKAA